MSRFVTSYPKGEIARQIALRGMSQKEFAAKAEIDEATLLSAMRGKRLQLKTFGKIHKALGLMPVEPVEATA